MIYLPSRNLNLEFALLIISHFNLFARWNQVLARQGRTRAATGFQLGFALPCEQAEIC